MPVAARRGAAIEISHLRKTFESGKNSVVAIDDLSISIAGGEFVCFVGPSGCGKSTLLRILAGLETADSGEVRMDAGDADVQNAMVFQEASIFRGRPSATTSRSVYAPSGWAHDECAARVDAALRMVGLTRFRDHYPSQISGGMKQRAAIARALVMNPAVLLMDEPFAALDAQNRAILQAELANICEQAGTTVVYITHSLEEALMLGDRTVVLTAQPARIKDVVIVPFARPRDTIEVRRHAGVRRAQAADVERARSGSAGGSTGSTRAFDAGASGAAATAHPRDRLAGRVFARLGNRRTAGLARRALRSAAKCGGAAILRSSRLGRVVDRRFDHALPDRVQASRWG